MARYTLKVYPAGYGREIYRTIKISGKETLDRLCEYILDTFDFIHEHLYEFCMDNRMYSEDSYQYDPEDGGPSTDIRRIIQTSYSPLYSSAMHNRFVHSMGVYHLGCKAIDRIKSEIKRLNIRSKNGNPDDLSKELFDRTQRRHPFWKSEAEYKAYVQGLASGGELLA